MKAVPTLLFVSVILLAAGCGDDPTEPAADPFVITGSVTDANGQYSFPDVPAGDYTVVITDTDNVLGELTPISNPAGDGTLDNQTDVTVDGVPTDSGTALDFGEVLQLTPSISDHILVYATSGFDSLLQRGDQRHAHMVAAGTGAVDRA